MPAASRSTTRLSFSLATPADAMALAELRCAVAGELTARFGKGHWSNCPTERGVLHSMRIASVWIARRGSTVVATFTLGTRKPWAIDRSYFTAGERPLYLTNMAVRPDLQGRGIGRRCVDEARVIARRDAVDAIRLDAYDAPAGAGTFYEKCGFSERGRVSYRGVPLVYYEALLGGGA